jgi:hypothetical protein
LVAAAHYETQSLEVTNMTKLNLSFWGKHKLPCFVAALAAAACLFAQSQSSSAQPTTADFRPVRVLAALPAITDAPVKRVGEVGGVLNPNELVVGVTIGKESRAYPINMLTGPSREIINDTLGGQAIAATW